MSHKQKKRAYNQHWFRCRRKIRHRWWIIAALYCVKLWIVGGEKELGWMSVYSCQRGARWYDEDSARHYHIGRKGRMKREKELVNGCDR